MRRPDVHDPYPAAPRSTVPAGRAGPGPRPSLHRSWVQRLVLVGGIGVSTLCLAAASFVALQYRNLSGAQTFSEADTGTLVTVGADQPQNWLVVGNDTRKGYEGNRTDTIMVVRVDPQANTVNILSMQRDLFVPIAGTGKAAKINSAYGADHTTPARLIDTIRMNFGIELNHYVEIDFSAFERIVDAVGGVSMYFDRPVRDENSGLFVYAPIAGQAPGCRTLNAGEALAFARSRYIEFQDSTGRWKGDGLSDFGRISRQQYFVRRVFERAAAHAKDPRMITGLTGAVKDFVKVDSKFDLDQTATLARRFGSFDGDNIKNWSLPVEEGHEDGQSVLFLRPELAVPTLNIFRGLDPHDADPKTVKFTVANGSGKTGQAAQVQEAFKAAGYSQAEVTGGSQPTTPRTTIHFGYGGQDVAAQLERHLTAGAELAGDSSLTPGEVMLVTGEDFTTVMRRPRPFVPPPPPPEPDASVSTAPKTPTTAAGPTTTKPPLTNTGDEVVGFVPKPPPGVTCD